VNGVMDYAIQFSSFCNYEAGVFEECIRNLAAWQEMN
jgi:hypothetical protein